MYKTQEGIGWERELDGRGKGWDGNNETVEVKQKGQNA